jgi:hypothetical protein
MLKLQSRGTSTTGTARSPVLLRRLDAQFGDRSECRPRSRRRTTAKTSDIGRNGVLINGSSMAAFTGRLHLFHAQNAEQANQFRQYAQK